MTGTREHLVWVTSAGCARDHVVIAARLAESSRANAEVLAQCGERFWPAPLIADPAPSCSHCVRYVRACREGGRAGDRHREGVIGRWLTAVGKAHHGIVKTDDRTAHGPSRERHP